MLIYPKFIIVVFSSLSLLSYFMVSSGTACRLGFTCLAFLPVSVTLTLLQPVQAQNQVPALPEDTSQSQPDFTDPNNIRPLSQDSSLLSMPGGQRLLSEANSAISSQNYAIAAKKLQDARQVFNQLSNFYQQLGSSFSGIDNRVYESQRQKAVQAAQLRDEATYQLALVHRAQNQPDLAVPLLIQIVRSQQPTRDLGKKAYQQLVELGFIDTPSTTPASNNPPASSSSAPQR